MALSTISTLLLASPFAAALLPLTAQLLPKITELARLILAFKTGPITPTTTHQFELDLQRLLRDIGRVLLQWVLNHLEPTHPDQAPLLASCDGERYRRRDFSPRRGGVATLFGLISLRRLRYEPCEPLAGLKCIFPLEMRLGLLLGKATPALASRLGVWTAQYSQETVRGLLQQEHQVSWSVATLRTMAAALGGVLAPLTHDAAVAAILALLSKAFAGQGPHQPVLSTGRDGIFIPIAKDSKYREAATATVSVLDRKGKRLGTVYLGHMPQAGQTTLSQQLTDLLRDVLTAWTGALPRLQYVTDGGHHPSEYFQNTLRQMRHPRTGKLLAWQWVIDYYHACQYVTKLAEALFGKGRRAAVSWAAKMRRWLRDKPHGIFRVLHSAAAHAREAQWSAAGRQAYASAYAYLRGRMAWMDYRRYRRQGLALGSGVTEAGCKIVFTQRFKQSGMKWSLAGGQVVVALRTLWLSGLWEGVYQSHLRGLPQVEQRTKKAFPQKIA